MLPDYYFILGVQPAASQQEVRAAYRRLAKQHHPDAGGTPEQSQSLRQAYEILGDPARRRRYDAERATPGRCAVVVEPLIPQAPRRPSRAASLDAAGTMEDFDRLFREFDQFFERLEEEILGTPWGRNE